MSNKNLHVSKENEKVIDDYLERCKANGLSENTCSIKNDCLRLLGKSLNIKQFKNATEKDLQKVFSNIKSSGYRDLCGVHCLDFYRWLFGLEKKKREYPENMLWFNFSKKSQKQREKDPDIEKYLITYDEYQQLLKHSKDRFGMWEAFWECLWITGGRPEEIRSMKIGDVKIDTKKNGVFATLVNSKKIPRRIPMMETPNNLLRWLDLHPNKDNEESWLWISHSTKTFGEQLKRSSINSKMRELKKEIGITKPISPKSFRKSRGSILFSTRNKDGARIYDTKDIGEYMGWDWKTVEERRKEYDLTSKKEIHNRFFKTAYQPLETIDSVKRERDKLEKQYLKEIENLKQKQKEMDKTIAKFVAYLDRFAPSNIKGCE